MVNNRTEDVFLRAESAARAELKSKQSELLEHIRPKKVGNNITAIFSEGSEAVAEQVSAAENRLKEIQKDREELNRLTGTGGMDGMLNEIARYSRNVSDTDIQARNVVQAMIRVNPGLDVLAAEQLPEVQSAYQKRDDVSAECVPKIAELREKITAAKKILDRYNGGSA